HPARHVFLDGRGADHPGVAEGDEHRSGGVGRDMGRERNRAELVGLAAVGTGNGHETESRDWSRRLQVLRLPRGPGSFPAGMKETLAELERWGSDVIFGRAKGFRASMMRLAMSLLSGVYRGVVQTRLLVYRR